MFFYGGMECYCESRAIQNNKVPNFCYSDHFLQAKEEIMDFFSFIFWN